MQANRLKELIRKYNAGTLSPSEKALLDAWYLQLSRREQVEIDEKDMQRRLRAVWDQLETGARIRRPDRPVLNDRRQSSPGGNLTGPGRRRLPSGHLKARRSGSIWIRYAVAATIGLGVLSGGFYLYRQQEVVNQKQVSAADIAPGGNRAVLTLPNGKTILLDKAGEGQLADEGGSRVIKMAKGVLAYQTSESPAAASYHTLATPRGGQYQVILPDGTRVWLNASSELRYPGRFSGEQRRVSLSGEGYFEVAAGKTPFVVATATMEAKVLGTHFNMKAYLREPAKTTLLEGSLLVNATARPFTDAGDEPGAGASEVRSMGEPGTGRLLRPGEEAVLVNGSKLKVQEADTEMAIAWKKGLFKFRNDSLTTVMRQLARWYDVEVVYEGAIPDKLFTGEIYRNLNASQVLEVLGYTGLHFKIQGEKIIVGE